MSATRPTPQEALDAARVNVMEIIRDGIPPREWVPGAEGMLVAGKRVHVTANAKSGKSISMAVVTAVEIVAAGGTVAILDRENGSDEYARRLNDVLVAWEADDLLCQRCDKSLRYYEWPRLSLDWNEQYPTVFKDVDLVIFDSSRSHTSPLELAEDSSDDFARFTTALIDPLWQVGIATVILDNCGLTEKNRPRGTGSKTDLCDVACTLRRLIPFSAKDKGRIELECVESRISEVSGCAWTLDLGGGEFGSWKKRGQEEADADADLRELADKYVHAHPGLNSAKIALGIHKNASKTREQLNILFRAGRINQFPSQTADKKGAGRPAKGWYPAQQSQNIPVPAARTELDNKSPRLPRESFCPSPPLHPVGVVLGNKLGSPENKDNAWTPDELNGWTLDELEAIIAAEQMEKAS